MHSSGADPIHAKSHRISKFPIYVFKIMLMHYSNWFFYISYLRIDIRFRSFRSLLFMYERICNGKYFQVREELMNLAAPNDLCDLESRNTLYFRLTQYLEYYVSGPIDQSC